MNVAHFQRLLVEERQRLLDAIKFLHDENPGTIEDETAESRIDQHIADTASVTVDREIDYSLEENAEHVLAEIEDALRRIDDGTYGICARCAQPIAEARLEARPQARKCIDCQRLEEHG